MVNSILTILTTIAVMLHALLGCCAHHAHAGGGHQHGVESVSDEVNRCHCHHKHDQSTARDCTGDDGGEQQHGDNEPCDEVHCSFVSAERSDDVTLALSLLNWLPGRGRNAAGTTPPELLYGQPGTTSSAGLLSLEALRAQTQVWLL